MPKTRVRPDLALYSLMVIAVARLIGFDVSSPPAIPSGAPRMNHTWETRHLAGPIQDAGSADHRGSVSASLRRCGLVEA